MDPGLQGALHWVSVAAVPLGLVGAWRSFHRARVLADTATARIRSAPQGYVELAGRAALMDGEPVIAPLTGLPCAWYRFRVEERTEQNKWRSVRSGVSDALFVLEDGTGRCIVDPDGAEVVKSRREVWYGQAPGGSPRPSAPARGWSSTAGEARYRYTEQRLIPGEELHALGLFRTVGGASEPVDQRQEAARLLERWKQDPRRMALFDRDGDGRIDEQEWEAARRTARRQVERETLAQALEPGVHLLARTGDPVRPYILAAASEGRLLARYRFQSGAFLAAAVAGGGYLGWLYS